MRAALILVLLAACGDDGGKPNYPDAAQAADANLAIDAAPARETITGMPPLQPGELVEGIMHGGPGDTALIHLSSPNAMMDWNIHSHATGHAVTVYEEYGKQTVDYPFTPPGDGDWYLLIKNSSPQNVNVTVEVKLYGAMTWVWE
jgi:hypothetical protein